MQGLNKVYLIGRDPDEQTSVLDTRRVKLSIATPHLREVDGDIVDIPDWHILTFKGRDADYIQTHARKGGTLAVECALRPNKWTDQDGHTHHGMTLEVEKIISLSRSPQESA